jgi:hypothetical protein
MLDEAFHGLQNTPSNTVASARPGTLGQSCAQEQVPMRESDFKAGHPDAVSHD